MKIDKFHEFDSEPNASVDKEKMTKYSPDFTKLKFEFSSEIQNGWAGDWDALTNTIKIHKGLNNIDKSGVLIHEFIEMVITSLMGIPGYPHPDYNQEIHGERNQLAHDLANEVERRVLGVAGIDWDEHEQRVDKVRNKKVE